MRFYPTGGGGGADLDVITAGPEQVLSPYVTVDKEGEPVTGTMPDNGAVSQELNAGGSYTIPKGFHNGSGIVTAKDVASQTPGTAAASDIRTGKTAWVNGSQITGNIATLAGGTKTPSTSQQTISCNGKIMTSDIVIPAFALPSASIIKKGATYTLYGKTVTGQFEGYVATATDLYYKGNNKAGLKFGEVMSIPADGKMIFETAQITCTSTNVSGVYGDFNVGSLYTPNSYNLTPYTYLKVDYRNGSTSMSDASHSYLYYSSSLSTSPGHNAITATGGNGTIMFNIANLDITCYLAIKLCLSRGSRTIFIDKVYFA